MSLLISLALFLIEKIQLLKFSLQFIPYGLLLFLRTIFLLTVRLSSYILIQGTILILHKLTLFAFDLIIYVWVLLFLCKTSQSVLEFVIRGQIFLSALLYTLLSIFVLERGSLALFISWYVISFSSLINVSGGLRFKFLDWTCLKNKWSIIIIIVFLSL